MFSYYHCQVSYLKWITLLWSLIASFHSSSYTHFNCDMHIRWCERWIRVKYVGKRKGETGKREIRVLIPFLGLWILNKLENNLNLNSSLLNQITKCRSAINSRWLDVMIKRDFQLFIEFFTFIYLQKKKSILFSVWHTQCIKHIHPLHICKIV